MTSTAHDSALQRLHAGRVEQDRLSERYETAIGTSTERGAHARLQAARDHVAAREAWLNWIDDEAYRGLDSGPFELLAERCGPRREGDRRGGVGQAIKARHDLPTRRFGSRVWLNGREAGGPDLRSRLAWS